jgi:ABC-type Mn2+/Zn2+ transport system permease subunit
MITGTLLTLGGLWISYWLDLASGATIILLLAAVFILSILVKRLISRLVKKEGK